jgi:hypothetical protein
MLACPACGGENPADARFCEHCGAAQVAGCPACGATPSQPTARFCLNCGQSLTGGTPYHLAQGLLDYAEHLLRTPSAADAEVLVAEAAAIADRLGARPVRERADRLRTALVR